MSDQKKFGKCADTNHKPPNNFKSGTFIITSEFLVSVMNLRGEG